MKIKMLGGVLLIILGICLGFYVGGYLMFFKGVLQIVHSITPVIKATGIAWGLLRIVFASLLGWLSASLLIIPGLYISKLLD